MTQDIDRIIARHLGGNATPEEQRLLQEWLAESEQHRTLFAALVTDAKPDTERAWQTFARHMRQSAATAPAPRAPARQIAMPLLRYAAAVALLTGIALLTWTTLHNGTGTGVGSSASGDGANGDDDGDNARQIWLVAESHNEARAHMLSDSSGVFLNRGSKLSCLGAYGSGKRELLLEGEAFFDVAAAGAGQLVVRAGQTLIRDVGTTFNVQAYPQDSSITVFVQSGEVNFHTEQSSGITLKAGETGTFCKREQTFRRKPTDANATAYMTKTFVFKNQPLSEVVDLIGKVYGVSLLLSDSAVATQAITVTFNGENIGEIVEVISETMSLQAAQSGNTYRMSPQTLTNEPENAER